jgi:hypothetical protein
MFLFHEEDISEINVIAYEFTAKKTGMTNTLTNGWFYLVNG